LWIGKICRYLLDDNNCKKSMITVDLPLVISSLRSKN
jgi:hypothetical protein